MGCGFCENVLSNSLGTLVVDGVVKPVGRQLDYVRRFHDNVEKLRERKGELSMARARLQHEIEAAEGQLLQIEDDVRSLQSKADATLSDVETLEKEIQQNKSCFKCCPNWSWRYQLSKKAKKTTMVISEVLERISKFGQPGRVGYPATSTLPTIEFLCSKDFVVSKSSETAFNQIVQALKDDNISMIGLWGMGGVGKTTLVREIGKQVQAQNPKLFDKVVITTVSKKPSFEVIQDQIAKYIGFDMKTEQGRRSEQELWLRLKKEERILIILDDVWTYVNLKEKIGIPVGEDHKGCKILLTTRLRQVCVSMDCQEVVQLGCLDGDEAWTLFAMKAGLSEASNDAIQKRAKQIIKKCQGLSIAIVTLGSALKGKSYHGWEAAYKRLKNRRLTEIEDVNEENAYLCLEASFDYLKNMETKICFLLCSLFPEDDEIYVENLVRFAWGLKLYKDTYSINEVRNEVLAAIEILKNSCLLLDCGERHVKMHDLVREVALWIASSGKEFSFTIKSEDDETLPDVESLKHYTAISFKSKQTRELPDGLAFPNLKIILHHGVGISGEFLQGMEALQVCALDGGLISLAAFQFQRKLRTLKLNACKLSDISMLGRLKALEILSLNRSDDIVELPNEIGDLENLRLLELSNCENLRRIPPNLLGSLFNLEELYLNGCWSIKWATENCTTEEESYSSLSELNLLPKLDVLYLDIYCQHLPDGFVFRKFQSFGVCIAKQFEVLYWEMDHVTCPISRCLRIEKSVEACKQLLENVESLELQDVVGHRNLVPSLDFGQGRFNKLTSLHLAGCESMKCLINASKQQVPPTATALLNLVDLSLREMVGLGELCNGPQPQGFLENLKTLDMFNCEGMIGGIPILQNLEELKVEGCGKMQVLFQIPEQESTHHFSLQCLKVVEVGNCGSLKHLFPMYVANGLGQLRALTIEVCGQLEEIIQQPQATNICLQRLEFVEINVCESLKHLFPMCVGNGLGQLQSLSIARCGQLEEIIQQPQDTNICLQSLWNVRVDKCDKLMSLSSLPHGQRMENLTRLSILDCRQLEYTFPISMAEGLPRLGIVSLYNLPEFKGRDGNDIVLTLPSLYELSVKKCPQLTPFIIPAKKKRLTLDGMEESSGKLEYLTISNSNSNSEGLFDSGYKLSSLKSLTLTSLTELRGIWNGPVQVENFQNLTSLNILACGKLRCIFTVNIAQNLPQLSDLRIANCGGLELIIDKDQTSSQDHHQPICFPNLSKIDIRGCGSLKCVLPVTLVHGAFPKLKVLYLTNVSKLEEVFERDEANEEEKVIHLPQFECLILDRLPHCASLSPVGYHFVFPTLQKIEVGSCPNITTSFSVDSKQSVHAKTQASQSVDEITVPESASAQETTWPLGSDIRWRRKCGGT